MRNQISCGACDRCRERRPSKCYYLTCLTCADCHNRPCTCAVDRGAAQGSAAADHRAAQKKRRTAKQRNPKPGIPGKDGLTPCPRCGQRWPELHRIFAADDEDWVAELACEACVFDDVYAGRVSLRRREHQAAGGMQTPEDT
jgi:hypothetical protein